MWNLLHARKTAYRVTEEQGKKNVQSLTPSQRFQEALNKRFFPQFALEEDCETLRRKGQEALKSLQHTISQIRKET